MNDQARNLRSAITAKTADLPVLPAIAITGGKGGVGKTAIAVNLALTLAKLGLRPLLVDFDLSLANADVMLGLDPTTTLYEVINGGAELAAAAIEGPLGIGFIPAASGRDELTRLTQPQLDRLFAGLGRLASAYDLAILDTAAGIGREVISVLRAARSVVVVVTPEPTSLTDAYALIKVLEAEAPGRDLRVAVNMADNQSDALATFTRLRKVVNTYLKRDVTLLGTVPRDHLVADAVRARRPFALGADGPAQQALRAMGIRIRAEKWK